MVSPGFRPSVTSKYSSPATPTLTGRKFATPSFTTNTPSVSFFFRAAAVSAGRLSVAPVLFSRTVSPDLRADGDDPRRGGQIGADVGGRLVERDFDFVVHGPVVLPGRGRRGVAHTRIGHLGHAADEGGVGERVDRDLDGVAEVDAYHVRLVHLHLRLDDGQVGDGQQQADVLREGAWHRYLTLLHRQPRHPARHRGDERGLAEIVARRLHRGARLIHLVLRRIQVGFGDVECRLRLLELLRGDQVGALRVELFGAPQGALGLVLVGLGLHRRRLRRGHRGRGLLQVRLVDCRVDLDQELALLHQVAFAHCDLRDASRDVRRHVDLLFGLDLAARGHGGDEIASARGLEPHLLAAVPPRGGADHHEADDDHRGARTHQQFAALGHNCRLLRLPQRPADRRFERGQRLVIVVPGVDIVGLGAQRRHLGVQQLEERPRADAVALRGQLQLLARCRAVRVLNGDRLKRRLERQVRLTDVGLHLQSTCPHRFLQILLLGLGLRHLQRLLEVTPQRDRYGEPRLERLRREVERIAVVLVPERLLLGGRVGQHGAVERGLSRVQPRGVLVRARQGVRLSALPDRRDRRIDVGQLLREPGPAGRQRYRRTPAGGGCLHAPPGGALALAQRLERGVLLLGHAEQVAQPPGRGLDGERVGELYRSEVYRRRHADLLE